MDEIKSESFLEYGFRNKAQFFKRYPDGHCRIWSLHTHELAESFYLAGMCGVFAVTLHERTGWDIVGIYRPGDPVPYHAGCRTTDGSFADVRGVGLSRKDFMVGFAGRTEASRIVLDTTVDEILRRLPRHPDYYRQCRERLDEFVPGFEAATSETSSPRV